MTEYVWGTCVDLNIDRGNVADESEFIALFAQVNLKIQQDPSGANLRRYNLGSELHTSPADASVDVMKNLTMRVQALQDW